MPDQPTWLERIPVILDFLKDQEAPPFLDRPAIEKLFGLRRRQAIKMLRRFGGYQIGKTFLVNTAPVIHFLENYGQDLVAVFERKQHVIDTLVQARQFLSARKITLPAPTPATQTFSELPEGIQLQPGRLVIAFEGAEQLLQRLVSLSQALAHDYEAFEASLAPHA